MIEPNGTPIDVLGTPNRQSKVPMGTGQTRQSIHPGSPNSQAQDDAGYGKVGTGGISDGVPGHTRRLDDCVIQGQDGSSHQSAFVPSVGPINKGAANFDGSTAHNVVGATEARQKVNAPSSPPGAYLFPGIID